MSQAGGSGQAPASSQGRQRESSPESQAQLFHVWRTGAGCGRRWGQSLPRFVGEACARHTCASGLTGGPREALSALMEGGEGKINQKPLPGARHSLSAFCANASQKPRTCQSPKNFIKMQPDSVAGPEVPHVCKLPVPGASLWREKLYFVSSTPQGSRVSTVGSLFTCKETEVRWLLVAHETYTVSCPARHNGGK